MTYRVAGLDPKQFEPFFSMRAEELAARGAMRLVADRNGAYPCRVSLKRVEKGEELVLLNHEHHPAPGSPYRARGPIFVSRAKEAPAFVGELPPMMRDVLLSLRAYGPNGLIVEAEICEGPYADLAIRRLLKNERVAYVHAHFARQGCFAAEFVGA